MSLLTPIRQILLADDDKDDNALFQEALEELSISARLTLTRNGEQLMQRLRNANDQVPDILFLDLNMPRKNGFECLLEINQIERLKHLPIIVLTTSYEPAMVNRLYKNGARYFVRKPNNFGQLKKVIQLALTLSEQTGISQPAREQFVLSLQTVKDESK